MADTENIFTPHDDTLSERIRAYRSVHEAYTNAEASLKFINDEEWADRLGEKEEIEQAYEISVRSLQMATNAIHQDELKQAQTQGFLSDKELQELIQSKRKNEMNELRDSKQETDSREHSHKS